MKQEVWVRLPSDTLELECTELVSTMNANVLQRPTLVLNRNWQPVNVATVARALVLLWNEAARVVDVADYQTFSWRRLVEAAPARRRSVRAGDQHAAARAGSDCAVELRPSAGNRP